MKKRLLVMIVGVMLLELLGYFIGVDVLANHIQIISTAPAIYALYRLEELHRHKR